MSFYSYDEAKKKTLEELLDEAHLTLKPIIIQSVNKYSGVVIALEQFYIMHQAYHASLKVLKK